VFSVAKIIPGTRSIGYIMDQRIVWIKQRIAVTLGVSELDILEATLADNEERLMGFFEPIVVDEPDEMVKRVLFVYRTYYDKLIEEEIIVLEAGELR
jgi:dynein heavy chain, axonemal